MFQVLKSGGLLMIPIAMCAIGATFIIFERIFYFRGIKKREKGFLVEINRMISGRHFEEAIILCDKVNTPVSKVVKKALECRTLHENHIKEAVSSSVELLIPELEHFLTPLGTISNISTLLGLLGTVTGNIQAFGVLGATASMGNPALLAGAIAEALVTTASGLVVSIPAVIFHNYFVSRVNRYIAEMEGAATSVILQICSRPIMGV